MSFQSPGDVLLSINGFSIYNYGIIMATACLVGIVASYYIYKIKNPKSNYEKFTDFAIVLLITGIIGARLYYCLLNPIYYLHNPAQILNFREGGLSIHGGLIAGIITLIIFAKKYNLGTLKLLDAFACATPLAQSIGRWGNFFNSEAFGQPTELPWKLFIPASKRPAGYESYEYFHPTFLYESILDLCIFVTLLFIIKKLPPKYSGLVFFLYLILYSAVRIAIESIRMDSALNICGIPFAMIMSSIFFIIGLIGIFIKLQYIQKE